MEKKLFLFRIIPVGQSTILILLFVSQLLGEPPVIDNKLISVSFSRVSSSAAVHLGQPSAAPSAANALAAAQWNTNQKNFNEEVERLAEYSASMYAKTPEEKSYYLDYYRNYYRNGGKEENATSAPKPAAGNASAVTVNGVEYQRYRE